MTPGNDGEGEVEQGEVVGRLLGPADQDGAEAVEPGMGALHHPAPRLGTGVTLGPGFLAPAAQVQREAEFRGQGTRLLIVEALIETEVLRLPAGRLWTPERDGFERLAHQLVIVAVGPVDHRPKGHAAAVGQQRALDPALAAVGRVGAGFSPRRAAPCPSLRPMPATSSQCPAARHRPATPRARTPRTHPPPAIPGSAGGPSRTSRCRSRAARSTDTPSAARRRSHPSPPDPAHADYGSLTGASAVPAAAALSWPIARPAAANRHPEHAASWSSVKSFSPSQIDGRPLRTFLLGYALRFQQHPLGITILSI